MAASEDLINFDVIETQKENIQSLPGGRSARTLASIFSPSPADKYISPTPSDTRNINDAVRQEFEQEIIAIAESDDPLDIYDRYVKWTLEAYPSAQATPQSQLLPLLERATKAFLTSTHYKNDPRYLKLWLHYIRLFSDSPRETFAFLARHAIGEGLALFYEEFAAWLEGAGRWAQAEEVYKLGLQREARPAERLLRKFGEFQRRFEARPRDEDGPSSPALPTVRPALAAKIDPFASSTPRSVDPQAASRHAPAAGSSSRPARQKLAIFSDENGAPADDIPTGEAAKGWENIGSLAHRKKENTMEPKPWAGETLKAGKKVGGPPKMMIFKDESSSHSNSSNDVSHTSILYPQQVVNPRTGKTERVFVNLEAIYPAPENPKIEMSFEELRAAHRGWLDRDWTAERRLEIGDEDAEMDVAREDSVDAVVAQEEDIEEAGLGDEAPDSPGRLDSKERHREENRLKKLRVKEVKGETQTIKAKLASPTGPKMKRKNSSEPTMTFHTRAATDEIYSIFNQPMKKTVMAGEEQESDRESDDDDDYTSVGESTGTGRISGTSEFGDDDTEVKTVEDNETGVKSVSEWSEFTASKHVPKLNNESGDEDEDEDEEGNEEGVREADTEGDRVPDSEAEDGREQAEELTTPVSPQASHESRPKTKFIPIPPEDYEPPSRCYRDSSQASQNRLPFMTPIVEKTESSIAPLTLHEEKDYFNAKTPSRGTNAGAALILDIGEELWSSPFQEIINGAIPESKKVQPPALKLAKAKSSLTSRTQQSIRQSAPKEIAPKGPIIKDTQCNPVDDSIRNTIFENLQPPLSSYDGYTEDKTRKFGRSAEIRKHIKSLAKMTKNGGEKTGTITLPPRLRFDGADREYMVKRELGKGAFAPVYLVEGHEAEEDEEEEPAVMGKGKFGLERRELEAVKMEEPPTPWEFYIMRQAKRRLGVSRAAESVIHAYEMHLFADEGFLVEEYRDQGTILDLVNIAKADAPAGGVMDETVVLFFTVELFRTMEALHSKGILHGDLKADNCLVRFDPVAENAWSSHYHRDGTGGWNAKGLALIDFGRGIDMKLFQPGVQFIADWNTGPQDCAEMREMRPWTYQIDYHGLAGIIHSMLFGKYIDTVAERGAKLGAGATKTYRIREGLKRYWQQDIWNRVFDLLLNPLAHLEGEEGTKLPILKGMRGVREDIEEWLEGNCERGLGLKNHIRRMEEKCRERRR
ncbi:MAG: hypothetical protein M1819_002416 [Sarea resinae]|nr:MAG: hypothetical protein M1819_002416 [Sarea resinae]